MRGVLLDFDTISFRNDVSLAALEAVLSGLTVFGSTSAAELASRLKGAEVILTNKVKLDATALTAAASAGVKLVCIAATGVNNVDLTAARAHGIAVTNVPAYSTQSVAQHVFALLLSVTQHLPEYSALLAEGAWRRAPQFTLLDHPIRELAGKTIGIFGFGDTGRAVAKLAEAFGMRVLIAARNNDDTRPDRIPLDALLPQVDVLSVHVPLLAETRGLIGQKELAHMKPDAVVINCARGGIVDEQALADALRAHRLGGAGIDVLSEEPPARGNPLLAPDIPNLIVTPHIAWATRDARQRVINEMAGNIAAFLRGEQRNRVA
ncbi:MAG TPA: D-2-hydroxyacid dehydrogenase [Gammaproteobacteria bacterium]|nr:D-2-hydroxyacid dehydrogenase [Gammaproteobacteria bacterium]